MGGDTPEARPDVNGAVLAARLNTAKIHVAFLLLLVIGVTVGGAARDPSAPKQPGPITAVAANQTSISATWGPSRDNVGVIGYDVYLNGDAIGTVATPGVSVGSLRCGTAYELSVNAFDAAGNRSPRLAQDHLDRGVRAGHHASERPDRTRRVERPRR